MVFTLPSKEQLVQRSTDINYRARIKGHEERVDHWDLLKLLARSKGQCEWCCKELNDYFAFDHILPYRVFGTSNTAGNLAVSCASCNSRKADRHPAAWAMILYVGGLRSTLVINTIDQYELEPLQQLCMFKSDDYIEKVILKRIA
jgi:5-methylcytosine-specific restriction endonuclease McrA